MAYTDFDDEGLIRLIAHADTEALGELYDRYGRLVFSVALRAVSHPGTAEEITQDVFLRIWKNARSYNVQKSRVSTWITSIARNRSIDMIRRYQIRPESQSVYWNDLPPESFSQSQEIENSIEQSERSQQVREAIDNLPAEQQEVLALAYFRGYSHREIAKALDLPLGTVKTRIRLGMQKLRTELEAVVFAE